MNFSKRAEVAFMMVTLIGTVVSAIVLLTFTVSNTTNLVSEADDLICRGAIELQSTTVSKLASEATGVAGSFGSELGREQTKFLSALNSKCKVDTIKDVEVSNEEEVKEEIYEAMSRCWYRYGEGKDDFLSSYKTTGNWCFTCAALEFEDGAETLGNIDYKDYIDWLKKEKIDKNGKEETYYETLGLKHVVTTEDELLEIENSLRELGSDSDPALRAYTSVLANNYENLLDNRLKKIDPSSKNYIVYRYNRLEPTTEEKLADAADGAAFSFLGAMVASIAVETTATAAKGVVCTVGVVVCSVVGGTVQAVVSTTKKLINAKALVAKISKISSLSRKISSKFKYSKFPENLPEIDIIRLKSGSDSLSIFRKIESLDFNVKDLNKFIDDFGDSISPSNKKVLENVRDLMDELNIKKTSELSDSSIKKLRNKLGKNEKKFKDLLDEGGVSDEILDDLAKKESSLVDKIDDVKAARSIIRDAINNDLDLTAEEVRAAKYYFKFMIAAAAGVVGGYIDAQTTDSRNDKQYVDIMTPEQYYRLCGPEPNRGF